MPGVTSIDMGPLTRALKQCADAAVPIRRAALKDSAVVLLGEAKDTTAKGPYNCPIDTGDLAASGIVDISNPDVPEFGFNVTYAAAVHANHPTQSGWMRNVLVRDGERVVLGSLQRAFDKEIARIASAAGGTSGV